MAILPKDHAVNIANSFIADISSLKDTFYVFFGDTTPWPNEASPPVANGTYDSVQLDFYNNLVFGKKINSTDTILMIPNYTWSNNTVFANFDQDDPNLFTENFYCVTSENKVFKCIYNNGGLPSTIMPTQTSASSFFMTGDGYVWKYLYTIDPTNLNNFASNNYIPLVVNSYVTAAAIPGAIPVIEISNSGSQYLCYNNDLIQNIVNTSVLVLGNSANTTYGIYNNCAIYINGGINSSQIRTITNYNGATKTATLNSPLNISVNMQIGNVSGTFATGRTIQQNIDVLTLSLGSNFSPQLSANVVQSDTGAYGQVVTVTTASDGVSLLTTLFNTSNITFSQTLPVSLQTGNVAVNGTITTSNTTVTGTNTSFGNTVIAGKYITPTSLPTEWRRVVTVTNTTSLTIDIPFSAPVTNSTFALVNSAATTASLNAISSSGTIQYVDLYGILLYINNTSNTFALGETVQQTATSSNGVVSYSNSSTLRLTGIQGTFTTNSQIVGLSSTATANVTAVVVDQNITVTTNNSSFVLNAPVSTNNVGDSATLLSTLTVPGVNFSYIVAPQVTVTGDGTGCLAYAVVNSLSNSISGIICSNTGTNYTYANVTITNNPVYGSGATARALLSPVLGHGANIASELGANYVGINKNFANSTGESHTLPTYGKYRQVGIIKNPLFNDVTLNILNFSRYKFAVSNTTGIFTTGEVVYQPSSNAAGLCVFSNTTYLQLRDTLGTFVTSNTTANTLLYGLNSGITAFINTSNNIMFSVNSNNQIIVQSNNGANGTLVLSNSSSVSLTGVQGTFVANVSVSDSSTNAYANVSSVYTANNTKIQTFLYFKQIMRFSLSSNVGAFVTNEVVTQSTNATGVVVSTNSDIDLLLANATGIYANGATVTQPSSNASGIVITANSTYLKLTQINGTFSNNNLITTTTNTNATVSAIYGVLNINNIRGTWIGQNANSTITGANSGAVGYNTIANTVIYPDLVRNSGDVIYIENITPVTLSPTSTEALTLVIKF